MIPLLRAAVVIASALLLSSAATLSVARAGAATTNCLSMQYHVDLARHALIEADVYDDEHNRVLVKTNVDIAEHELRVAEHLGEPSKCLSASQLLAYLAAGYHLREMQYANLDPHPEGILHADASAQRILQVVKRSTNPDAYDELKKYAGTLHRLAPAARSMLDSRKKHDDFCRVHGENVCNAIASCEVGKKSQRAAPDGYLYWDDVLFFDAQVDVDATGKVIEVRVHSVTGIHDAIDRRAFGQRLLVAKFKPAALLGPDGKCTASSGTAVFEEGTPVDQ